ncbi:MAG TPA: branched-chain amino acid ABC transporter substrate-binding protein, partial [Ilumatobacter sp.]
GRAGSLAVLLVLAAVVVGCDDGGDDTPEVESVERAPDVAVVIGPDAPIVIGVSAPITGPDSAAGIADRDAVIVAVERWKETHGSQIQGHDIAVAIEDDGCTEADVAAVAARRLAERPGVVAVVGPNCSAGAVEAVPIYAAAGLTTVSGSVTQSDLTTDQPAGGFFFRTAYRNDLEGALIGTFVVSDLQAHRGYLVDDGESYGQDLADSAQQLMERHGVDVERRSVVRGTVDFRELVHEIVDVDPEFVGFMGFNPEAALMHRQLRDAGYDGVFGGGDAAATPDYISAVGEIAEGTLFAGCVLTMPADLVADFVAVHGGPPGASAFTAQQIDATTLLLDAIAEVVEAQPDGSILLEPRALRDAVSASQVGDGASGSFAFDANGDRIPPDGTPLSDVVESALAGQPVSTFVDLGLVPCQVQDGRFVNLMGPGAQPMR